MLLLKGLPYILLYLLFVFIFNTIYNTFNVKNEDVIILSCISALGTVIIILLFIYLKGLFNK